jgi:hypothetical protein
VTGESGPTTVSACLHAGRGRAVLFDLSEGGSPAVSKVDPAGWSDRVDLVPVRPNAELDAAVMLIRPDGFIAHADRTGDDAEGLRLALTAWFGEPTAREATSPQKTAAR